MLDILLVQKHSASQIQSFMAAALGCQVDRIKVFEAEEFYSTNEQLDDLSFDCLCIFSSISGDMAQLLQILRYEVGDNLLGMISEVAFRDQVQLYVPLDSYNSWALLGDGESLKFAKQIDNDDVECYCFQMV